jgi:hypothetical protein
MMETTIDRRSSARNGPYGHRPTFTVLVDKRSDRHVSSDLAGGER